MPIVIALLRAVNVGGTSVIRMEPLRALCESLGFRDVRTYVQSGNLVFRTTARDLGKLARRIEDAIENEFGARPDVILRTAPELRDCVARNPFAERTGIESSKLLVTFLASEPTPDAREKLAAIEIAPEELHLIGRDMYTYFPNGIGISKLPSGAIAKALGTPGTGRNWNTVTRLLQMAEELDKRSS